MPTLNVDISEKLDTFVSDSVSSGRYENANAVIHEALLHLEREEQQDRDKLKSLRDAIAEGDASGIYEGDAIADIRKELNLPSSRR